MYGEGVQNVQKQCQSSIPRVYTYILLYTIRLELWRESRMAFRCCDVPAGWVQRSWVAGRSDTRSLWSEVERCEVYRGQSQRRCRYVARIFEPKQRVQVLESRVAAVVSAAGSVWVLADVS